MSTFDKKVSLRVAEQFPDFVRSDNAGIITFLEKYYQFLESAELVLESIGLVDQLLLEEGTTNYILLQNENIRTESLRETNRIISEDSDRAVFVNGETITGQTSKSTATIRVEDINANSRLFISAQNLFVIGEEISGNTSGANAIISSYRANPVENISQLMEYADVDNTIDTFFDQFKIEFLKTIPKSLASGVNKRNLLKNIKDLYRSKGTRKAHELFFRLLLNENVEMYYPSVDMLRASDGKWSTEDTVRVLQDNDVILMEDDVNKDIFLITENGAHFELEDSTTTAPPPVNLAKLIGQTITQDAVNDVSIEQGGTYADAGFSTIAKATGQIESVTQFTLGSTTVYNLILAKDKIVGTFVAGQNVYGVDNTNSDLTLNLKVAGIVSSAAVTSSGQYYTNTDPLVITADNGASAQVEIDQLTHGNIENILVDSVGSGYEIGDTVTVNNTGTYGTGLIAEVGIVNGGIAPEAGSLTEQFRYTLENEPGELLVETSADGSANGISLEAGTSGQPGEIITEDGFYITQEGTVSTLVYFTQEEDYGMAATDHFILEDQLVISDTVQGNKLVQESGTGVKDITDIKIKAIGTNYQALPILTLPTTSPRTGAKVIAKGTDVGKIRNVKVSEPGIHYTETPSLAVRKHLLLTGVLNTFTIDQTLTGGTSSATATIKAWDADTQVLKLASITGTFVVGETVTQSTGSGIINSIEESVIALTPGTQIQLGYYKNQDGWISEASKKLQDSYYYQDFSYVVKTGISIEKWRSDLNASIHPAGWQIFGQIDSASPLDLKIRATSAGPPELVTARDTYTPDLFSAFVTIFTTKVGRRLGGVSQTLSSAPLVAVSGNTALSNAKDVSLTVTITTGPIVWSSLSIVQSQGGAGVRVGNAETYKYYNLSSLAGRMELETATGAGFVQQEATGDARDYFVGDSFQVFRTHEGYYEKRDVTTLNEGGTLSATDTSITLTDASKFPTQGIVVIESEHISYTGKSSHTLTGCTRGADIQGSTDAATHSDGTKVYNFKFIHTNAHSYRIQDVGSAVVGDVVSYPQKRYHVPVPSEITLSYT